MKKLLIATAAVAAATASFAATNPATTNFQVQLVVQKACAVTAGSLVDFGVADAGGAAATPNPSISVNVTCSKGTAYTVGLLPSNNATNGLGALKLGTETIAYQLRSTAGTNGTVWGDSAGTNTIGATGNGTAQPVSVYGTIEGSTNVTPGTYSDTVKVNVRY